MGEKSWAERHPIVFGALVGSVVPGIGTLAGAFGGVIYSMTTKDEEKKEGRDGGEDRTRKTYPPGTAP